MVLVRLTGLEGRIEYELWINPAHIAAVESLDDSPSSRVAMAYGSGMGPRHYIVRGTPLDVIEQLQLPYREDLWDA